MKEIYFLVLNSLHFAMSDQFATSSPKERLLAPTVLVKVKTNEQPCMSISNVI